MAYFGYVSFGPLRNVAQKMNGLRLRFTVTYKYSPDIFI